jgi:N-formylglutamate deformylase
MAVEITPIFRFHAGTLPLLISVPHAGRALPGDVAASLLPHALELPDTDWYVDGLYDFASDLGASFIFANYSRYVIDLNRAADDRLLYPGAATSTCLPLESFAGAPLYAGDAVPNAAERTRRLREYWQPYHRQLAAEISRITTAHGQMVLLDGHSIAGRIPRLFDGELPTLNLGTHSGKACSPAIGAVFTAWAQGSGYDFADNGRFKGGYITRHYGRPAAGCHAVQLEINQSAYLDSAPGGTAAPRKQDTKSQRLEAGLRSLCQSLLHAMTD